MSVHGTAKQLSFQSLDHRDVVADFDGGEIVSDAGGLLLREIERARGVIEQLADCFVDERDEERIDFTVRELLAQRIYAIALGYEDVNDHETLRNDTLLATLVDRSDPTGQDRRCEQDRGTPLAGKSTLNRLELGATVQPGEDRYKKIHGDVEEIEKFFVEQFLDSFDEAPDEITLDFDATDSPLHGKQENRFFHGYFDGYCYLPLYVFCDDHLLLARLRPSNIDGSAGTKEVLEWMVPQIRERWPEVRIIIRGDSAFARDPIMSWCEANNVDYVFGLATNSRLKKATDHMRERVWRKYMTRREPVRQFHNLWYSTLDSWSKKRRVVAKIEHNDKGPNRRFVVTSIEKGLATRHVYKRRYCGRGDMENRIKEKQLSLFSTRLSTTPMDSNQLRLWLSSVAYVLMSTLRRVGLAGTELASAQVGTIRTKLFKIGALVKVTVRRVVAKLSSSYPYRELFHQVTDNLRKRLAIA